MKKQMLVSVLALGVMVGTIITACGKEAISNASESQKVESGVVSETSVTSEKEEIVDKKKLPTVTLYPKDANLFSGLVTGFRGDLFAENGFQLEVWAYSDEKTNAILTGGDLPDMMYVPLSGDTLTTLIETDKIINYDDYKDLLPNYFGKDIPNEYIPKSFDVIRENYSAGTGELYALPFGTGLKSGFYNETGVFDRHVVKLNWDVYEKIGMPEIKDKWHLIDIMEEMLNAQPALEDGTKCYGTFLDIGMDTNRFGSMYLWYVWHGYMSGAHSDLVEVSWVTGEVDSILTKESLYYEGLKWYNEVYRRGLMDPDSISTARPDQMAKVENGLAMVPSGTAPGWADTYYEVFLPDLTVYQDFTNDMVVFNTATSIVINKETEHLEECLAFVNMLADPYAWLNLNYGPEGSVWQKEGNVLSLTDECRTWIEEKGGIGAYPMPDGTEWSTWNTAIAIGTGTPIPGYVGISGEAVCADPTTWPDAQAITTNSDNWNSWKEHMNADNLWDYCEKNNIPTYTSSVMEGIVLPKMDDSQTLALATINNIVVPASWQCVYAETEEEFEEIWNKMVEDAIELGAQEFIDWKIKCYIDAVAK